MAWPTAWSDGEDLTATRLNQFRDALATWGGNVAAAGYNLTGAGTVSANVIKIATATAFVSGDGPKLYKSATLGTVLQSVVGSSADFAIATPAGIVPLFIPTGTNNLSMGATGAQVLMPNLPTSAAGLPSGALWIDTAAGRVIKQVA